MLQTQTWMTGNEGHGPASARPYAAAGAPAAVTLMTMFAKRMRLINSDTTVRPLGLVGGDPG